MGEGTTTLQGYRSAVELAEAVRHAAFLTDFRVITDGTDAVLYGTDWPDLPVETRIDAFVLRGLARHWASTYAAAFCAAYMRAFLDPEIDRCNVIDSAFADAGEAGRAMLARVVREQGAKPFASVWLSKTEAQNDVDVLDWADLQVATQIRHRWMNMGLSECVQHDAEEAWSTYAGLWPTPVTVTARFLSTRHEAAIAGYLSQEIGKVDLVSDEVIAACARASGDAGAPRGAVVRDGRGTLVYRRADFSNQPSVALREATRNGDTVVTLPLRWGPLEVTDVRPRDAERARDERGPER